MNRKYLLLPVLIAFIFACKKENQQRLDPYPTCMYIPDDIPMVKTKQNRISTMLYEYDSYKRISKIIATDAITGLKDTLMYEYYGYDSFATYRPSNPLNKISKHNLSLSGLVHDIFQFDANCFKSSTDVYCMAADYCTQFTYFNNGINYDSMYQNISGFAGPMNSHMRIYNYITDKKNTIGNMNFGQPFYGKSSYNLLKETVVRKKQFPGGGIFINVYDTISNQYEFDEGNRVSKQVSGAFPYDAVPIDSLTTYYTYY